MKKTAFQIQPIALPLGPRGESPPRRSWASGDRLRRRDEAALLEERTSMKGIAGTLLFALFLSASLNTGASTITAASCSAGDVSTALNSASSGDTVNIPSGTCHWSTQVAWTAPSNVILHGAGSTSVLGGGDATVIVDDYTTNNDLFKVI